MDTIILAGICANIYVQSMACEAHQRGCDQVFVEHAMSARSAEEHSFVMMTVFPA